MARSPLDDVSNAVKDAAYVSVGLGVIAFQRLQVRRNELEKALSGQADDAKGALGVVGALVGERLKAVEERLDAAREQLSGYIPGTADR
jgi:hypothetical protein